MNCEQKYCLAARVVCRLLSLSLLLPVFGAFAAETNETVRSLPFSDKHLSAYAVLFTDHACDVKHVERMIDRMGENGFNAIETLILSDDNKSDYKDIFVRQKDVIKPLVDRARAKGMDFNVYLYPYPDGVGGKKHDLGKTETWLKLFPNAVEFAKHRKELGIASVRFDIETTAVLMDLNEENRKRITEAVKGFADALRQYDPDLVLGYMPADHHLLSFAFDRALATDRLPAFLDAWDLYNGEGYTTRVGKRAEAAKKIHPNNRFIPWIRHNSYYAEDIGPSAYQAAKNTDGYSSWILGMLDPEMKHVFMKGMFALPKGEKWTDYWAGYKAANDALRTGEEIPFKKPRPLVPTLNFEKVVFPEPGLLPYEKGGKNRIVTCDPHVMFVPAKAGETIRMRVTHLAGNQRPLAVHYAVMAPDRTILRDENINPGASEAFSFAAAKDGVYALYASGGSGGQAWYSVECDDHAFYLKNPYLFGPQRFRVYGSEKGNAKMTIASTKEEAYKWRMNGGEWHDHVFRDKEEIVLPAGEAQIEIVRHPATAYCQNFTIRFPDGKFPYVKSGCAK